MKRYGLIGYPLSHSFSKKYFEDKFRKEGITDCLYELYAISSINELKDLLTTHDDLCGLNVTIPYKQVVIPFLNNTDNLPPGLNACNCIKIEDGQLIGFNTDIAGFEQSFRQHLQPHHKQALVLGSGGAAAAVAFCLDKMGIDYKIVRRTKSDAALTYDDVTESVIASHQMIINTTPLGMHPNVNEAPPLPYHAITNMHYLFDLHYNPPITLFMQKGIDKGATVKNGHEMLVTQAEESWKIWNGKI